MLLVEMGICYNAVNMWQEEEEHEKIDWWNEVSMLEGQKDELIMMEQEW